MFWILIITALLFFYVSKKIIGSWFNPVTLFSGYWLVISIVASLGLYGFYIPDDQVWFIVMIGIISFSLGGLISYAKGHTYRIGQCKIRYMTQGVLIKRVFYVLFLVVIVFNIGSTISAITLLLQGRNYYEIRDIFYASGADSANGIVALVTTFVIDPIATALIPISIAEYLYDTDDKKPIVMAIILVAFQAIKSGGRIFLLQILFYLVFAFVAYKKSISFSKRQKKFLLTVSIVAVIAIVVLTISRQNGQSLILYTMYKYYAGALVNLKVQLYKLGDNFQYSYGMIFFMGLLRPIMTLLNFIGIPYGNIYDRSVTLNVELQETVLVGGDNRINAFVTLFFYFYRDGGLIGVSLCSFIFGYLTTRAYKKAISNTKPQEIALYIYLVGIILFSMVRWEFYIPQYAWALVFMPLLYKKVDKDEFSKKMKYKKLEN